MSPAVSFHPIKHSRTMLFFDQLSFLLHELDSQFSREVTSN